MFDAPHFYYALVIALVLVIVSAVENFRFVSDKISVVW